MNSPLGLLVRLNRRANGGTFNYSVAIERKEKAVLEVTLTNEQKVRVSASPVTAAGNPAPLDGPVSFTVQAGDGTVEPIDDTSAYLVSGTALGDTIVLVSADADLGAGVETVADTVTLHVEGARAQSLGLTADAPELK